MGRNIKNLKFKVLKILRIVLRIACERNKHYFFEKVLSDPNLKSNAKVNVTVRIVTNDDIPVVEKNFPTMTLAGVKERFKTGHVGFGAELHGELVNTHWFAFNEAYLPFLDGRLRLDSDSAYIYDVYTLSDYRGLGIAPKVFAEASSYLFKTRKIRKFYVAILSNNFPSLQVGQKEDLHKIGAITHTRIFSLNLYQFKGETKEDYYKLRTMLSIKPTNKWWQKKYI